MRRSARILTLVIPILLAITGTAAGQSPPAPSSPVIIGERSVLVVQLSAPDGAAITAEQQAAAADVIAGRLEALGAADTSVSAIPDGRIRIDIGDPAQADAITRVATAPGQLAIIPVPDDQAEEVRTGEPLPEGMPLEVIVPPGHVANAALVRDELDRPAVELTLDDEAAQAFDAWAAGHQGALMALVLDDVVVSVATINAPRFEGRLMISGAFEDQEVAELVAILAGGPLPLHAEPLVVCPATEACPVPSPIPGASPALIPGAIPSLDPGASAAP